MPKEEIKFEDFLMNVDPVNLGFINETHEFILDKNGWLTRRNATHAARWVMFLTLKEKHIKTAVIAVLCLK